MLAVLRLTVRAVGLSRVGCGRSLLGSIASLLLRSVSCLLPLVAGLLLGVGSLGVRGLGSSTVTIKGKDGEKNNQNQEPLLIEEETVNTQQRKAKLKF